MTDIAELFARDPSLHTKQSIDEIIVAIRAQRANFNLGLKVEKIVKPKEKGPVQQLDLSTLLGIEI